MGASFRRQHPVAGFFLDYYCADLKLGIEVDGPAHDPSADAARDHVLLNHGIEVLRFSVQELDGNLEGVVSTIHREVHLRLMARKHRTD